MCTFGELRVLLRIHQRKKAAAKKREVKLKLEPRQNERIEEAEKLIQEAEFERKRRAVMAEIEDPEFSRQNDKESMKISPESRKTPTEPDEVISGFIVLGRWFQGFGAQLGRNGLGRWIQGCQLGEK